MRQDAAVYDRRRTPLLSVAETADYFGCSRRTIERLISRGELVPVHVASRRRLRVEELDAYLEARRASSA